MGFLHFRATQSHWLATSDFLLVIHNKQGLFPTISEIKGSFSGKSQMYPTLYI